jgi:ketosteroid isomerase-like protein
MTTLVLALLAAQAAASNAPDCRAESPAVRDARAIASGIVEADNARDLERVLGHYAADAVLMPPGEGPVSGLAAIRPRYVSLFEGFDPQIVLQIDEACVGGDGLAFVRGRNRGRLLARAGGAGRELDDVFVMLLRRATGGSFRISHLIWHRASADRRP